MVVMAPEGRQVPVRNPHGDCEDYIHVGIPVDMQAVVACIITASDGRGVMSTCRTNLPLLGGKTHVPKRLRVTTLFTTAHAVATDSLHTTRLQPDRKKQTQLYLPPPPSPYYITVPQRM